MRSHFQRMLLEDLKEAGYSLLRRTDRHAIFSNPTHSTHITVPQKLDDHRLYKKIRKAALRANAIASSQPS